MRIWEIDFFRGIAIILMVIFNWAFALSFFHIIMYDNLLFWNLFPRIVAGMFIIIAGISFSVSYSETKKRARKFRRGAQLFLIGMLATLATYIFFPQYTIIFGILHLLGISVIIAPLVYKMGKWLPLAGIIIIGAGLFLQNLVFDFPFLVWLGFIPKNFHTFDYFPLMPWLGIFLMGMFFGNSLFKGGNRRYRMFKEEKITKPFCFLGRHSLLIYVIHQPILLGILFFMGYSIL